MKTDSPELVGKHCFEVAGLGLAPFRFIGLSDNVITNPDGTSRPGGSCDYCGNGIRHECHVKGADGRQFKVGSDCIAKVGDAGLLRAFKTSPAWRAHQRKLAAAKAARVSAEVRAIVEANKARLAALPHPRGFTDRATGAPLTALDQAEWMLANAGKAGRAGLLGWLKRALA